MSDKVSVVLVGISGYGSVYLREILSNNESAYLKGVVDISPTKSIFYSQIIANHIPIYTNLEEFYNKDKADLAIISTPIHIHAQQACIAMENGSHVLCEKPAASSPIDLDKMILIRNSTNRLLAIGYNWSFAESVQQLKQDILSNKFGRLLRMRSLVLWPRNADYFHRSDWAGKKYHMNGELVLDSVANNAASHFLHHLFYLAGETISTSASIHQVCAELYKANPIETFDTCAVHILTSTNVEILFLASHAVEKDHGPKYKLEFENATIDYHPNKNGGNITATFVDGSIVEYEDPEKEHLAKFYHMIEAIQQNYTDVVCGPEAASSQVVAIQAMHQSVEQIPQFPKHWLAIDSSRKLTIVQGLQEVFQQCYTQFCLPNDIGTAWSEQGKMIQL
ncbi:Gfo/Idh/MocA family protein [Gracilibacillus marinus]|uniref:Gfo/Idh/MocA family protein n=1 Tax=Gracilibacillus marinus TaxID=630535 RepID=A0ABV8W0J4_9BACI